MSLLFFAPTSGPRRSRPLSPVSREGGAGEEAWGQGSKYSKGSVCEDRRGLVSDRYRVAPSDELTKVFRNVVTFSKYWRVS